MGVITIPTQSVPGALSRTRTTLALLCAALVSTPFCLVSAHFDNCGVSVAPLVTGGRPITKGEYPWLVALYQVNEAGKWNHFCGGALISPRFVITAAHCVVNDGETIDPKKVKVGLGKLYRDFYRNEDYAVIADVAYVAVHDNFFGSLSKFALDIGLVELSTDVELSDYILPVCIDFDSRINVSTGATVHAAGWGRSDNETSTERALAADLSYLDNYGCLIRIRERYRSYVTTEKVCATNKNGGQVDRGDSGGALTYSKNGRHFVVGVVSTKIIDQTSFSIFTDLSNLEIRAWLKNKTEISSDSVPSNCGFTCTHCGERGQFPWAVTIYHWSIVVWSYACSGTLITPHIVLTHIYCVKDKDQLLQLNKLQVGLGRFADSHYKKEPNSVFSDVREIIYQTNYKASLTLLDLSVRVRMTDYIRPACLDWNNLLRLRPGTEGQFAGWGYNILPDRNGLYFEYNSKRNENIVSVNQTYMDDLTCHSQLNTSEAVKTRLFCAERINGRSVFTSGDGVGFTVTRNGQHYVVGVYTGANPAENYIYVYISLAHTSNRQWLKEQIARLETTN